MKKIFPALLIFFITATAQADTESSMNFGIGYVKPFLSRLIPIFDSGINEKKVNELYEFTKSISVKSQNEVEFDVIYKGKKTHITFSVYMDDIDSPDVYFFTSSELAKKIDSEMEKFTNELGI